MTHQSRQLYCVVARCAIRRPSVVARVRDSAPSLQLAPPQPVRELAMAEAPPLLAAQALLLAERGRDLIVFNPGAIPLREGGGKARNGVPFVVLTRALRAGSTLLRVGRASDAAPLEVPHCVAFPRRGAAASAPPAPAPAAPSDAPDAGREAACRQARRVATRAP